MARLSGTRRLDGGTIRQLLGGRKRETWGISPAEPRGAKRLPTHHRIGNQERPASQAQERGKGYLGFDWTRAVGVRYGTPLYVHLRGTEDGTRARTLSRESHSLHVEKDRKNITCLRPRANDVSGDATQKPYDRVPAIARPDERTRYHTPLCAHRW